MFLRSDENIASLRMGRLCATNNPLAHQQVVFILDLGPLVRIGRSGLPLNDRFPAVCQFEVERNETRLILWDVIFCKNRVNRAFHNA